MLIQLCALLQADETPAITTAHCTVLYCTLCVTIRQVKKEPLIGALTDYCIKDMGMVLKTSALANIS
eukprot:4671-Heterococcus_DN1.PRE.2